MKAIKAAVIIIIILVVFIFTLQNHEALKIPVGFKLNLHLKTFEIGPLPLYGVMLFFLFIGVLTMGVIGWIQRMQLRAQARRLNKLLIEKDRELNSLRNLPVMAPQEKEEEPKAIPETTEVS